MQQNEAALIELRNVSKSFDGLRVLEGVSFALAKGQTTVVIGPSGCGKTVLLKHIIGLIKPDRGEVYFDKHPIHLLSERQLVKVRMRFGFLFQGGALFDSMTVAENVAFPLLEHTNLTRRQIAEKVAEKLAMVGLDGLQEKKPAELSGGQKKRVALARAIALDPEVILYDEPTTGLDPVRADVINELIIKLASELGVTSVAVTHDMASAYKVADRIMMLYEGKIIADGSPEQIRNTDNEIVRKFITGQADEKDLAVLNGNHTKRSVQ